MRVSRLFFFFHFHLLISKQHHSPLVGHFLNYLEVFAVLFPFCKPFFFYYILCSLQTGVFVLLGFTGFQHTPTPDRFLLPYLPEPVLSVFITL